MFTLTAHLLHRDDRLVPTTQSPLAVMAADNEVKRAEQAS